MAKWLLEAAARNHKGILRQTNEDNFYLNGRWLSLDAMEHGKRMLMDSGAAFQVYAVCDGMGGETSGELASFEAVRMLGNMQTAYLGGMTEAEILLAIRSLSDEIYRLTNSEAERAGTTLTGCLWLDGRMRVINVGDSRVYRLRGGKLAQLTVDHSEVQQMVALGLLTPFQARLSPRRHLISQYIGMPSWDEAFCPYVSAPFAVRTGDCYLLCSDGLVDMVEDEAIRHLLLKARTAGEAVDGLVQQALDNGGHDNITALCVMAHGPGKIGLRAKFAAYWSRVRGEHY